MRVCVLLAVVLVSCTASSVRDGSAAVREVEGLETLLRRVIGGTEVEEGMWPWLVALTGEIPTKTFFGITLAKDEFFCGASLINRQWILTAAHCFYVGKNGNQGLHPKYWKARFGDTDRESTLWDDFKGLVGDIIDKDEWKDWVIKADRIIIHPNYIGTEASKWQNDIALVKLSEPVPVDPHHVEDIQSVALAPAGDSSFPADGQKCIFKGWGCTKGGGRAADVAFQVTLPKWKDSDCTLQWRIPAATRLCAGHQGAGLGICPGDSGGPLVCKKGNTWYQVGVASFTAANYPANYPGVFTRVSAYADWIKQTIDRN